MVTLDVPTLCRAVLHLPLARAAVVLPHLNATLAEFEINTRVRVAAFLAQVGHECGSFQYLEEIASGDAYDTRTDLGNTPARDGDGRLWKGRGWLQTTGAANYKRADELLGLNGKLIARPQLAAEYPLAARLAGLYWADKRCNMLADLGTQTAFDALTKRINGGHNGKPDRDRRWHAARAALGLTSGVA